MSHSHATTYYLAGKKGALTVNPQVFDPDSSAPLKDWEECLLGRKLLLSGRGCSDLASMKNPAMK